MKYSEEVKKNCLRIRYKFGNILLGESIELRHTAWVKFVEASNLTSEEKLACVTEFLNPEDCKTRYKRNKNENI